MIMEELKMKRMPEFIIFTGPMFGAKTSRLLSTIDRFNYQNRTVVVFKPKIDRRYSESSVTTHNGLSIPAISVSSGSEIFNTVINDERNPDVIAVDEAFMIENVASALIDFYQKNKKVLNYYGCKHCGGYHLTSGGRQRKKAIKKMLLKTLDESGK